MEDALDKSKVSSPPANGMEEKANDDRPSALELLTLKNSAINNGNSSLQLAVLNKNNILIWHYHQYKTRSVVVIIIKDMIYKGIKAFSDVGDINKNITTIQPVWSQFSPSESYSSSTPIPHLEKFITALSLTQEPWTKTPDAHKIFLHTFVALSKTSPEIFETAWTKKGNLLPSTAGSLWSASNNALGSSWSLITPIKITAKIILVRNKKNLKSKGKSLTFDP